MLLAAKPPHWDPLPKFLLTLPTKVPHQPVGVEGILRGHAPAHDGIQKSLPLSGIEAQNLARAVKGRDLKLYDQNYGMRKKKEQGTLEPRGSLSLRKPSAPLTSRAVRSRPRGSGERAGPTSMLPPTRARRGGRGLSLSLLSCLLDCRRPPREQTAHHRPSGWGAEAPPAPLRMTRPSAPPPKAPMGTLAHPTQLSPPAAPEQPGSHTNTHSALPVSPQSPRPHPQNQWNTPTGCPRGHPATL